MRSRASRRAKGADPRILAVEFLALLERSGARLDSLSADSRFAQMSPRDRRLTMELAYGVERWRGRLDFYLSQLSRRPPQQLDGVVRWTLRVALYQLEFLRLPARAAVYEAVESCRRLGKGSAASFVNALLRSFLRQPPPLPAGKSPEELAIRYSHPSWLVSRYLARYGPVTAEALLARNNLPPLHYLWVNPRRSTLRAFRERLSKEGVPFQLDPSRPSSLVLGAGFSQHRLYREGWGFFIDPASQRVAEMFERGGSRLGDACSAPGGKAFLIASDMGPGARLHCSDVSWHRLREMKERAALYGMSGLTFAVVDWTGAAAFKTGFDSILVDAPCSGLGTLRSNPDIRWKVREVDLPSHHARQVSLLGHAFGCLRRGGSLLYSTCSTEPEENEEVVAALLAVQPAAKREGEVLRTYPLLGSGDRFFACRIRHV